MTKWYVITGILALLLVVSLVTCSSNSDKVDRLKDEVAELSKVKVELDELQISYDTLLSEYNKLKAETSAPPTETPPPETRIEKLPYSWTEGVFLITIEDFFKYDELGSIAEKYDWYKLQVSFKNTSHVTTKADIHLGDFKLKTEKGNLYDLKYVGCQICNFRFDPEQSYHSDTCSFRIEKGEKPVELWLYEFEGYEDVRPMYAEQPIVFKLES